jgi:hypothetical protein
MNVVGLLVVSHGFVVAENWIKPPPPPPQRSRLLSASFECKRPNYHLAVFATLLKLVMGLPQNNRKEKKIPCPVL